MGIVIIIEVILTTPFIFAIDYGIISLLVKLVSTLRKRLSYEKKR